MIEPYTLHDWAPLKLVLQAVVDDAKPKGQVEIRFITGAIELAIPSNQLGRSFMGVEDKLPEYRASIGLEGAQGGGTLGGYMILTTGSQGQEVMLAESTTTRQIFDQLQQMGSESDMSPADPKIDELLVKTPEKLISVCREYSNNYMAAEEKPFGAARKPLPLQQSV
ncbi:uncharacterized protein KY384_001657 [Bacidia gigantensis]|uniref:uncharacterized protein n=1 Tax=Bacidia gigantensis TaxID=2732470 RepID=UPI001D03EDA8|nr:uncharacterized protein KY384_001657 [Bacidia gigantensis]KAG8533916.1 hypothetical protein KY384_001657 [Bacidia gigantensis]